MAWEGPGDATGGFLFFFFAGRYMTHFRFLKIALVVLYLQLMDLIWPLESCESFSARWLHLVFLISYGPF